MSFHYRLGEIQTNTPWNRPSWGSLDSWWKEFKDIKGTEHYDFFIVGHALYDIENTWDIDIAITGDIVDLDELGYILRKGLNLALNKYSLYIDLKWYSSIGFAYTNNGYSTRRLYLRGALPGVEEKIRNEEQELYKVRDYKNSRLDDLLDINKEHPILFTTVVYPGTKHMNKPADYNKNKPILLQR